MRSWSKPKNKSEKATEKARDERWLATYSTAHYFLEAMVDLGVDYIFANLGTDHVSLIEEIARWDRENRAHPDVILCPHEIVAVHMAGGYALATGRGQAVFVHVDAGTRKCLHVHSKPFPIPPSGDAVRGPCTFHDPWRICLVRVIPMSTLCRIHSISRASSGLT